MQLITELHKKWLNHREIVLVNTGLLSVTLVSVAGEMTYERCYLVESRNECFFYPLNWKTSWKWAQTFCSDHGGKLVSVYSAEVDAHT